jgi:hypothetical protein
MRTIAETPAPNPNGDIRNNWLQAGKGSLLICAMVKGRQNQRASSRLFIL